jgi:Tfp pilus assembly protein PilN
MVTDLNSSINQKEQAIASYGDLEQKFRFIQRQIEDYRQFKQESNLIDIFPILNENIPNDVIFETLLIRPGVIGFTGAAFSQEALNVLVNNLQLNPHFAEVSVNKIESRGEKTTGFDFDIKARVILDAKK